MNVTFRMRGFAATVQQFANSVPKMVEEMSAANRESIKAVQDNVVPRIPVDTGETRLAFASPDAIQQYPDGSWQFGLLTEDLQKRGFKGKFIEFGTKGHGDIPAMPARPFVRPGAEATHDQILALQRAAMQAAIDRQAKEQPAGGWLSAFDDSASAWKHAAFVENLKEGLGMGPPLE